MAGKVDDFFDRLKTMFADIPYELARDREVHYQNILYIIFKLMGFYVQVEYHTSRGRIDLVLQTQDYVYIICCIMTNIKNRRKNAPMPVFLL